MMIRVVPLSDIINAPNPVAIKIGIPMNAIKIWFDFEAASARNLQA